MSNWFTCPPTLPGMYWLHKDGLTGLVQVLPSGAYRLLTDTGDVMFENGARPEGIWAKFKIPEAPWEATMRKFPSGTIVQTATIAAVAQVIGVLPGDEPSFTTFCMRKLNDHLRGNWGTMCAEDAQLNEDSLRDGGRLHSSYAIPEVILACYDKWPDKVIWIITEADRSVTTILFPSEY